MKLFQALINLLNKFKSTQTKSALNGKEINLTGDNTIIKSNNFIVDKNGNVTANSATLNNAKIINGQINLEVETDVLGPIKVHNKNNNCYSTLGSGSFDITGAFGSIHAGVSTNATTTIIGVYGSDGVYSYMQNDEIRTPVLYQTSLESQKKNFEKMQEKALDIIKQIDIYKYNLKSEKDTDKKHIGFVIGDKYKYSTEVTNKDNTGVDDYSFISLCCKSIQEQQEIIEKQNKTIEELTARVEKLEKAGEA